jgi:hypothetical protein
MAASFDTQLFLVDPDGALVAENNNSDGSTNSRIAARLTKTGTYSVEASSHFGASRGSYTLTLTGGRSDSVTRAEANPPATPAAEPCAVAAIRIGQTVSRALTDEDCAVPRRRQSKADRYALVVAGGERLTVSMRAAFDTYLFLLGPNGSVVAENDDDDGTNSRIELRVDAPGTYTIEAVGFDDGARGNYTLAVTGGAPDRSSAAAAGTNVSGRGLSASSAVPVAPRLQVTTDHLPKDRRYPFTVTVEGQTTAPGTSVNVQPPSSGRIRVRASSVFLDQDFDTSQTASVNLPPAVPVRVGVNRGDCLVAINGARVRQALPTTLRMVPGEYQLEFSCDALNKQWIQSFTVRDADETQSAIGRVP